MAHDVMFNVPFRSLGKSDIKFQVKINDEVFGELQVSKGSLVWFPKGNTLGHKIGWSQFDRAMQKRPKVEKRK